MFLPAFCPLLLEAAEDDASISLFEPQNSCTILGAAALTGMKREPRMGAW
jgi:hypothetical protein